ncbi:MAG: hypothetical protein WBF17_22835 [Phycisphaerae bacterium]
MKQLLELLRLQPRPPTPPAWKIPTNFSHNRWDGDERGERLLVLRSMIESPEMTRRP